MKRTVIFAILSLVLAASVIGGMGASMQKTCDAYEAYYEEVHDENVILRRELAAEKMRFFDIELSAELQAYTYSMCSYYNISEFYPLVLAVMKCESNFDAAAYSSTGDYGIMQINEINHTWLREELGIVDFMDPYQNIKAGIYMLSNLLNTYSTTEALMCYNMGESGAAQRWAEGVHETDYTDKVYNILYDIILLS